MRLGHFAAVLGVWALSACSCGDSGQQRSPDASGGGGGGVQDGGWPDSGGNDAATPDATDAGACDDGGGCTPGDVQSCGSCGIQTCSSDCGWGPCTVSGVCAPTIQRCGAYLTLGPCPSNANSYCAAVTSPGNTTAYVWLADQTLYLEDSQTMGTFPALSDHELAYVYAIGAQNVPELFVLDVTSASLIAWLSVPPNYTFYSTYFNYVTDPSGNKYPFLAPGAHYLGSSTNPGQWDFLCIFDPAQIANPDPSCYTGFQRYDANLQTISGFRHGGGWISDLDGDGWSDINLPFLDYVLTLSGSSGAELGLSYIDPASTVPPPAVPNFDSGRLYGGYTVFQDPNNGLTDTLFAGANGVGTFSDPYCNVSRFFLLGQWTSSQWQVVWDDYFTFAKTIFNLPDNSVSSYSYLGHDLDGCAHRFGHSMESIGGSPVIVFDYFTKTDPTPACQDLLLLEQESNFTDQTYETTCPVPGGPILAAPGTWSVRFIDALTGAGLNSNPNYYAWGHAKNVLPGNPELLLVQALQSNGGVVPFEQTADAIDSFELVQLTSTPSWSAVASFASPPSPPAVADQVDFYCAYPPGIGSSNSGVVDIVLDDVDGDGLNDIQLQNGQWLGYSEAAGGLALKGDPSK